MNSGTFIILLTATFPTLATLSFLLSLAAYLRPLEARAETKGLVDSLEELEDIIAAQVRQIGNLRRIVVRERQRTRRLEKVVRNMARQDRRSSVALEDAEDEADAHTDNYEEGGRIGSELPTRGYHYTSAHPSIRQRASPTIVRSSLNANRTSPNNQHITESTPLMIIRGGAGSARSDDEAPEVASAMEMPPSPEHDSTHVSGQPSILTHIVRRGNEETRARMLVDEDIAASSTHLDHRSPTTHGVSRTSRPDVNHTDNHDHVHTPFDLQYQPTLTINYQPTPVHAPLPTISPTELRVALPRGRSMRIAIPNNTEELRRTYILTQILENTRPRIRPGNIATVVEAYTRSLADDDRARAESTNEHPQDAAPTNENGAHAPSPNEHVEPDGDSSNHTFRPTLTLIDYDPDAAEGVFVADEAEELFIPLLDILYTVRPRLGLPAITDIIARYITALGLGFTDHRHHVLIRPSTAIANGVSVAVNGIMDSNEVEDLTDDTDEDTTAGYQEENDHERRPNEPRSDDEGTNGFHINCGIVTQTQDPIPDRLTADPEDIRPRPRLSTPELNEAIGERGNVVHTSDGPVLILGGEGTAGHEFHLHQRRDSLQHDDRTNGYAIATQIAPSESSARVSESPTSESSTRSSRSTSLNGTTLVNSVVSLDGNTLVASNSNTDGETPEDIELYRNNAYETPAANLRRRRAVSNIRRAARLDEQAETGGMQSDEESMNADTAEAEDAWWDSPDRRYIIEVEMQQHGLERERAAQVEQRHDLVTNGVESEESETS